MATPTGMELIGLIREELLKSAELTGIWEKKLRQIEKNTYDAKTFLDELKQMVTEIVHTVLADNTNRRVTLIKEEEEKKADRKKNVSKPSPKKKASQAEATKKQTPAPAEAHPNTPIKEGAPCPVCGKGHIIKGKTAYGCSEWRNGCTFRHPLD